MDTSPPNSIEPLTQAIPSHQQHPQQDAHSSSTEPPTLLSLPGELRNQIYAYVLFPSHPSLTIFSAPNPLLSHPLFITSRQLRHEAITHLCATKDINFGSIKTANDFFAAVGEQGVRSLRRMSVRCPDAWYVCSREMDERREEFLGYLSIARGLRSCEVVVGRGAGKDREGNAVLAARERGVEFLVKMREILDGRDETARDVMKERLTELCAEVQNEVVAVQLLREECEIGAEGSEETKVFRWSRRKGAAAEPRLNAQIDFLDTCITADLGGVACGYPIPENGWWLNTD
ncbi:hypothetical protein N0V94_002951 [Neodidymelliopsis sp. IMI 364377]|nr:hypothetical protein N0V94_002951 [Neodidymelliopsis sp. IMI 364377]